MDERSARWAAVAGLTVWLLAGVAFSPRPLAVALAAGAVGIGASLLWRRTRGRALIPGLVVVSSALLVLCLGTPQSIGWFGTCVLVVVASLGIRRTAAVVVGASFAVVILVQYLVVPDPGWFAWAGGLVLTLVACWAIEREQRLVAELREAQAGLAERSRAEERTRVAREMHDVMGHALTVSLLHITAARLAVAEDPAAAAASLAEAERLSRASLDEVRAAVGVLRDGSQPDAPLPGAGDLPALVAAVERSGLDVTLTTSGDPATLSEVAGLAVYRIVQEALTNVVRHAPAALTTVVVAVGDTVTVRVDSAAPGRADARPGNGVAGMTERATALGGSLTAGPGGPGWRVEATWPLRSAGQSSGVTAGVSV